MTQGDVMKTSRRDYLKVLTAGAGLAAASGAGCGRTAEPNTEAAAKATPQPPPDHERRIQWWRDAKFGMFIHWGLYSQLGRQEWVMALEDIPVEHYEKMAKDFRPKPNPAGDWAKLAKQAGMKYMVMTTKHHEGFCNFDSKLTDYCATKQGPGRDLVTRIRGSRPSRGTARRLLLLADGLAPPRRDESEGRPSRAPAICRLHPRPDSRADDELRKDRRSVV